MHQGLTPHVFHKDISILCTTCEPFCEHTYSPQPEVEKKCIYQGNR